MLILNVVVGFIVSFGILKKVFIVIENKTVAVAT